MKPSWNKSNHLIFIYGGSNSNSSKIYPYSGQQFPISRGDLEFLRTISSGSAEAALHGAITQRVTLGHQYDSVLVAITHLDVSKMELDHGTPTITLSFVCQHAHCVRDVKTGDIIEGSPENIENVQYIWNLKRNFENPDFEWEITQFMMQFTKLMEA